MGRDSRWHSLKKPFNDSASDYWKNNVADLTGWLLEHIYSTTREEHNDCTGNEPVFLHTPWRYRSTVTQSSFIVCEHSNEDFKRSQQD